LLINADDLASFLADNIDKPAVAVFYEVKPVVVLNLSSKLPNTATSASTDDGIGIMPPSV